MKYAICEQNYKTLSQKLARLNDKLARISAPAIKVTVVGSHDAPHPEIQNALIRYIDIEVETATPECNGWSFIATLVHTNEGNIVRSVPGYDVPVTYRDRPTWCDHCKTNRTRRDTYVVRHADGRVMQVGSNCLQEFIGGGTPGILIKTAEYLLNAHDICDAAQKRAWLGGSNALSIYRIDTDTYLSYVAAVVLKEGQYVTRKIASESCVSSTSDLAQHAMNAGNTHEVTPEAEKLAQAARAWVVNRYSPPILDVDGVSDEQIMANIKGSFGTNTELSEFEHNLLACARAEAIEPRLCGLAAYIVEAFRRNQPRPEAAHLNSAGLSSIFAMFETAKADLKRPAIRLADEEGRHLHLSLAKAASKNAGFVYVKADSGYEATYYGKISPEGRFLKVNSCPAAIELLLQAFASDPEGIATKYGRLTGCCSFCGRKLTDKRSTTVGYGPTCSAKFGMAWGKIETRLKRSVVKA